MNKPRVISHGSLSLNLADVKCFRVVDGDTFIVDFKTRYEYILNPGTSEYEKQEFNETIELEFPTVEAAHDFRRSWVDSWQYYLDDQVN